MIELESDEAPLDGEFDIAIVAVGYESRCRWVSESIGVTAKTAIALEFGFLTVGAYTSNHEYFKEHGFQFINGLSPTSVDQIAQAIAQCGSQVRRVMVDVSSMSREMIANVVLGIHQARKSGPVRIWTSYAASKYSSDYNPGPIRRASPIKAELAGWSARPEMPLGAMFGLGCEPGLALGALQVLEPDKTWTYAPRGFDDAFEAEVQTANQHIDDIFDVTAFIYDLTQPTLTRGKFEALLNAVGDYFRIITVPFGPKMFAWLTMGTVIFAGRRDVGVWTFSSGEQARAIDREAEGPIIWHHQQLSSLAA